MAIAESNRLEYKRELDKSDKLEKAAVSFLNYNGGGEILVGVADDGTVVGISDSDGDQRKIADRLSNNIRPKILGLFDVVAEKIDGKDVIRIAVSSGTQKPYYIRKRGMNEDGCFIRVGASAHPMTEAMIERLIAQRQTTTLSTMPTSNQSLTFEQLHIYYSEHGLALGAQFADNLDLKSSDGAYNFLAYLLADSNGASIKVAKYAGTDKIDLVENEEYGYRCLITAVYRVLDKLDVENKTFAKITSRNRLERRLFDAVALREAFINAVVHNDYSLGWPVVEFYSDRVTITSTGGLVEGLSDEDFFKGLTMLRNRELMRVFKDVELVEMLGSGMQRILSAYDRSVFEITPSFIIATFPYAKDFERSVSDDKADPESDTEKDPESDTEKDTLKNAVNETQQKIIEHIKGNPAITIKLLAAEIGINERNIKKNIKALKDKGLIVRIGADRGGHWEARC
ncbi:MAG: putative DNA binding domain-containing protein [Clostridiales Family XIII bacterium]|jgi:predicted HTH transcriptional regulator|nr:putative DNA binding domain-containing protein [Clostridiales Family XIII bacterium]